MRQRFGRILQFGKGVAQLGHRQKPLIAHQPGAQECGHNDDAKRRPKADGTTDLNEQSDLNKRNRDKKGEKPHNILVRVDPRVVDLAPRNPYIRAEQHEYHHTPLKEV